VLVLTFTGPYGEGTEILRETFFWSNVPHRAGVDSGPQSQIPDISVIPEEGAPGLILAKERGSDLSKLAQSQFPQFG